MKPEYIFISLVVAFLWGIAPVFQKHLLKKFDKYSLMLFFSLTYVCIVVLFSIFNQKTVLKDIGLLSNNDIFKIVIYVFFTIFMTNLMILHVLKSNDAYIVAALEGTAPLFTLVIVYLFFSENITAFGVFGAFLIVLGVFCISLNDANFKLEEFVGIR